MTPQELRTFIERSRVEGRDRPWHDEAIEGFWNAVWDKGHVTLLDEYYARTLVRHAPAQPRVIDLPSFKAHVITTRERCHDLRVSIDDRFFARDKGVLRFTWSATHNARGRRGTMSGICISRYGHDGRVVEEWLEMDMQGLARSWA